MQQISQKIWYLDKENCSTENVLRQRAVNATCRRRSTPNPSCSVLVGCCNTLYSLLSPRVQARKSTEKNNNIILFQIYYIINKILRYGTSLTKSEAGISLNFDWAEKVYFFLPLSHKNEWVILSK
jgi:hypothetical protein